MIRIVKERTGQGTFEPQDSATLQLIGMAVIDRPGELGQLLKKHGFSEQGTESGKRLAAKLLNAVLYGDGTFHKELAATLAVQAFQDEAFDNFDFNKILGGTTIGGGGGTPMDPVSAIAAAVGSVANVVNGAQQKKALQQQARAQTFTGMLGYRAQQEQLALQARDKELDRQSRITMAKTVGTIVFGLIVVWFMFGHLKGQQWQSRT